MPTRDLFMSSKSDGGDKTVHVIMVEDDEAARKAWIIPNRSSSSRDLLGLCLLPKAASSSVSASRNSGETTTDPVYASATGLKLAMCLPQVSLSRPLLRPRLLNFLSSLKPLDQKAPGAA
ncbi:hypothetical protein B7463_g1151, partial [Scytalidium lignicola]